MSEEPIRAGEIVVFKVKVRFLFPFASLNLLVVMDIFQQSVAYCWYETTITKEYSL